MGDTQDENNENIINTHLQEQEQHKEANTSPYVFNCSNPELGSIDWDIKEENITIDEELKQRKKKRTKEVQGFPPMFDDIVAKELLEEEDDVPASHYRDFYEYDDVCDRNQDDMFLKSAASVTSLLSLVGSLPSFDTISEMTSCPTTPPAYNKQVLTISASKRKRKLVGNSILCSPPFVDNDGTNKNDDGNIYGSEYITGTHSDVDVDDNSFQTLRAAFSIRSKTIPKKTTFLTLKQLKKKYKQSPDEKLKNVVSMLKQVQYVFETSSSDQKARCVQENSNAGIKKLSTASCARMNDLHSRKELLERAQTLLGHSLGANVISLPDLLTIVTASITMKNKPLASFHDQLKHILSTSNTRKNDLAALDSLRSFPLSVSSDFPEFHKGIGQVNATSRSFLNLMSDLLSPQLLQKIKFMALISHENAIINFKRDQLSSQFSWQTVGMKDMGYPDELSFNGLIRCSYNNKGMISSCTISYDCYTICRSFFRMSSLKFVPFICTLPPSNNAPLVV